MAILQFFLHHFYTCVACGQEFSHADAKMLFWINVYKKRY